jgi:hypothetical protein
MNFPFESVLQVIAAFAIFVTGFLALFLAIGASFLVLRLAYRGANWMTLRVIRFAAARRSPALGYPPEIRAGDTAS